MKKLLFDGKIAISFILLSAYLLSVSQVSANPISLMGVFQGITPCSRTDRPMPQIPAETNCEEMIWKITLYWNSETHEPATYQLHAAYGLPKQNTTGLIGTGTLIDIEGDWRIIKGMEVDESAIVYELNPDTPESAIYFVKLDDNLLHVLSSEKRLMVGNGGWSYTLNRTKKGEEAQPSSPPVEPLLSLNETSTSGVFEGRMPCADLVIEFTKFPATPSCIKIKIRLNLYRDAKTGDPTTYFLKGTETTREGAWTETRGTATNPNSLVYQLSLGTLERSISFLRMDDNHLFLLDEDFHLMVGDALWSYTLSRNTELSAKINE